MVQPIVINYRSYLHWFIENGPTRAFFVYKRSFQTQIFQKNCKRQQDSNLDRRSRRQALRPLDHHHGPNFCIV